jgi:hypothetical protein
MGDRGAQVDIQNAELAQISFYLSTENKGFDDVIDPDQRLAGNQSSTTHDFEHDGAPCRFIYFETSTAKTAPPWLTFANEKLGPDDQIAFPDYSKNANGVLLIRP